MYSRHLSRGARVVLSVAIVCIAGLIIAGCGGCSGAGIPVEQAEAQVIAMETGTSTVREEYRELVNELGPAGTKALVSREPGALPHFSQDQVQRRTLALDEYEGYVAQRKRELREQRGNVRPFDALRRAFGDVPTPEAPVIENEDNLRGSVVDEGLRYGPE